MALFAYEYNLFNETNELKVVQMRKIVDRACNNIFNVSYIECIERISEFNTSMKY